VTPRERHREREREKESVLMGGVLHRPHVRGKRVMIVKGSKLQHEREKRV